MSRTEWILGGLLVVLLVIVAGLALLLWLQPDLSDPPSVTIQPIAYTPAYDGQTALVASVVAQQVAQGWQPDAKLYRATATWPGVTVATAQTGATTWDFTYYSPGQTAVSAISVIENQATLLQNSASDNPLAPLDVAGWKINSPEAVVSLLREGGQSFIEQEGLVTLIMTLTTDNGNGRIEWFLSLFGDQTGNSFTIRLDATSGEVLEIIQAP